MEHQLAVSWKTYCLKEEIMKSVLLGVMGLLLLTSVANATHCIVVNQNGHVFNGYAPSNVAGALAKAQAAAMAKCHVFNSVCTVQSCQ